MRSELTQSAQQACKAIITEHKRYNLEHHILHSETAVVEKLLKRDLEMKEAYQELSNSLQPHSGALEIFPECTVMHRGLLEPNKEPSGSRFLSRIG